MPSPDAFNAQNATRNHMNLAHLIIAEINTPSGQVGPLSASYRRGLEAIGHGVLGAAFMAPFGWWGLPAGLAVAMAYWLAKEAGDLKRGGKIWDGIEDAAMVCLGAWWSAWWWPGLLILCGGYVIVCDAWRRR